MKLQLTISTVFAFALAACGGTTDTTTGGGGTTGGVAGLGAGVKVLEQGTATRIAYDKAKDQLVVESIPFDDDVFEGRYNRTKALDRPGYQAYTSTKGFDTYVAYYGVSSTGSMSAAVVATNVFADHGYNGAVYSRTGTVTLPSTAQRAFYNGTYVGLRTDGAGNSTMDTITGLAQLEADFSDNVVRGGIRSRVAVINESGTPVGNNLILGDTSIDRTNATFTGAVSEVIGGNDGTGTYEGMFGGTNATEMAGVLVITAGDFKETGVFVAEQ